MAVAYRIDLDTRRIWLLGRRAAERRTLDATRAVLARATVLTPVDTGNLRRSNQMRVYHKGLTRTYGEVYNSARYACVFDPDTKVVTESGLKRIADVRVGDKVLTQSGDYRAVVATSAFPASEKPDLVTITVPWRSDWNHRLTVTTDHKILVRRDGVNRWVMAGDVTHDDELFVHCNSEVLRKPRDPGRFCGVRCRDEHWRKHGHWMVGKVRGAEFSARQSVSRRKLYADRPDLHPNRNQTRRSRIEEEVAAWLDGRAVTYERQMLVAGLWVDFYVPDEHRIYEVDGARWHRDFAKDVDRDRRILAAMPGVEIVHIHHYDARFSPKEMTDNPLPGVFYVKANPGPKSFVEPTVFRAVRPLKIEPWTWRRPRSKRPGRVPYLYDLSVEGEHSFVASGIVVSNSWVHDGTRPYVIRPRRKKALKFTVAGETFIVARVRHPGVRAQPWLRRALVEVAPRHGFRVTRL